MWTLSFLEAILIMKRILLFLLTITLFAVGGLAQTPTVATTSLKVGDKAPDFELNDTTGAKVRISDFRGKKNVVLAFYVLAFTGG